MYLFRIIVRGGTFLTLVANSAQSVHRNEHQGRETSNTAKFPEYFYLAIPRFSFPFWSRLISGLSAYEPSAELRCNVNVETVIKITHSLLGCTPASSLSRKLRLSWLVSDRQRN